MNQVEVAPRVLRWALERSGKKPESLERRFPHLNAWLDRHSAPTVKKMGDFAAATYTLVACFFLATQPLEPLPIQDFRTRRAEALRRPSGDLLDTICLCRQRQSWFEDFSREEGLDPKPLVGSLTRATHTVDAASAIRATTAFDLEQRKQDRTWAEALRRMTHSMEHAGILITVTGTAGGNTQKKLDPDEFRGIALAQPLAAPIFVNGAGLEVRANVHHRPRASEPRAGRFGTLRRRSLGTPRRSREALVKSSGRWDAEALQDQHDFAQALGARICRRFQYPVVAATRNGRTAFREAMWLVGCKRSVSMDSIARRIGVSVYDGVRVRL